MYWAYTLVKCKSGWELNQKPKQTEETKLTWLPGSLSTCTAQAHLPKDVFSTVGWALPYRETAPHTCPQADLMEAILARVPFPRYVNLTTKMSHPRNEYIPPSTLALCSLADNWRLLQGPAGSPRLLLHRVLPPHRVTISRAEDCRLKP